MEKRDGKMYEDGWLMRWDLKRSVWVKWMPWAEWEARKAAVAEVNQAISESTEEDARTLLAKKQTEIRAMRKSRK